MTECQKIAALSSGKKIRMVDATASNCWVFYFSDGTNVAIHTDGAPLKASVMETGGMLSNPFKKEKVMVLRQIELWRKGEHIANIPTGEKGHIPLSCMPGGELDYDTKLAIMAFALGNTQTNNRGPWSWWWKAA